MAEKRLIDAMKTVTKLSGRIAPLIQEGANPMRVYQEVLQVIAEAPTVDAVEVVRCEKCKHALWDEENEMWKCVESSEYDDEAGEWYEFYEYHNGDFFCSYGERRTDG